MVLRATGRSRRAAPVDYTLGSHPLQEQYQPVSTPVTSAPRAGAPAPRPTGGASFASLRHPAYRAYCASSMGSMLGDNIEHVITYWVLWQTFHSPLMAGFAVIAHWSPALFFSVWSGQLA